MEFINKANFNELFESYTFFENRCWNNTTNIYKDYDYSNFLIKKNVKNVLIGEQNGLCCYCMKYLYADESTTIEHLYPQKPSSNIFKSYNIACTNKASFDYTIRQIPNNDLINLPHDISYYNLLACCEKCNNSRGNKEIKPFIFDINVKNKFKYNDLGNIFSLEYKDEILKIELSSDYYINHRRLWKHLAKSNNISIFKNDKTLKDAIKKSALELFKLTNNMFYLNLTSKNELYVKKAIDFKYFF